MTDQGVVVDASAVLALLQGETFARISTEVVVGAWINAVNLSEVLTKLRAGGLSEGDALSATAALDLRVVDFDRTHAQRAAKLWPTTRRAGLSLGDRACLATALILRASALTADRAWAKLDIGADVVLIR